MKRIFSSFSGILFLFAFVLVLSACESQVQYADDEMTLQAKNAVDVLPSTTAFVAMLNVDELKTSALGSRITDNMHGADMDELQDLIEATGFNPEEDLKEIYVTMDELGSNGNPGVSMVAYASLDAESLRDYVEERAGDELQSRSYRGVDLYEFEADDHVGGVSIANDDMILMASEISLLEGMIDRLLDEGNALSSNSSLMELVSRASAGKSAWFVANKPDIDMSSAKQSDNELGQSAAQLFTAMDQVAMAFNVDGTELDSQFFLYPASSVSADDLEDLLKGMRSAMRSSPDLTEEGLDMLDGIKISSSREFAQVQIKMDSEDVDGFMN